MGLWTEIAALILLNFLTIAALTLIGRAASGFLLPLASNKPFREFFTDLLLGLVIVICIFSILQSGLKTINILMLVMLIGLYFLNPSGKQIRLAGSYLRPSIFFYSAIITSVATLLSVFYAYKGGIDEDIVFYVNISAELGRSGNENILHYFNDFKHFGTMPYHYIELWLGALLFKLEWFDLSNAIVFRYGCYGILRSIAIVGLIALAESIKKIAWHDVFLCILLSIFNTLFITEVLNSSWALQTSMWLRPNLMVYYPFLCAALIYLKEKAYFQALWFTLAMTLASGPTGPAVYSSVATGLLVLLIVNYKNKGIRTMLIKMLLGMMAVFIATLLFYKLTGEGTKVWNPRFDTTKEIIDHTVSIWKAIVFFIVTLPVRAIGIIVIPVILMLIVLRKKSFELFSTDRLMAFFPLMMLACSITIFQLISFVDNTYQFPYVAYTACYILSVYLFYHIVNAAFGPFQNTIAAVAVISFLLVHSFNVRKDIKMESSNDLASLNLERQRLTEEYIAGIRASLQTGKPLTGAYIYGMNNRPANEEPETTPYSTGQLGSYAYFLNSNIKLLPFTDPCRIYEGLDADFFFFRRFKVITDVLPFYNPDETAEYGDRLKKYFSIHNVDFIIADKYFNIEVLGDICISKHITDKKTGHQFIELCHQ